MSKKLIGLLSVISVLAPSAALAITSISLTPSPTEPPAIDPTMVLSTIITWVFGFLLVIVVLMVLISGYMFVTAGGNPESVTKARNWLMYALIGLAVAVLGRGLVALVLTILGVT